MTSDPLAPLLDLPGVPEAVDAARAAVDALLKERVLRTRRAEVRAAALARAATASADLDVASGEAPDVDTASAAALRVLSEVRSASLAWGHAPLQALARLHTLAAVDRTGPDRLGRPRDDATSGRLVRLASVVTESRAPGLVVGAVVHGELLALQPFDTANALVARAAQRLVLVDRGVDPDALTVPEEGLVQLGVDRYRVAAEGFASGSSEGLADWLTFVAAAVQRGASVGRDICADLAG